MGASEIAVLSFVMIGLGVAAVSLLVRDLFYGAPDSTGRPGKRAELNRIPAGLYDESGSAWLRPVNAFRRLVYESGLGLGTFGGLLMVVLFSLVSASPVQILFEDSLLTTGAVCVGGMLGLGFMTYMRSRRLGQIQEQLPQALEMMARASRAGESLDQSLEIAGEESEMPLGSEIRWASRQLEMGLSMSSAMRSLVRRVPLMEMRIFATTLTVHRQTGGGVAYMLERLATVIRDRLIYRRQFKAATASGRMAATLMLVLWPGILIFLASVQPNYLERFVSEPMGWTMLATGFALQIIGLGWIMALLRTDY